MSWIRVVGLYNYLTSCGYTVHETSKGSEMTPCILFIPSVIVM